MKILINKNNDTNPLDGLGFYKLFEASFSDRGTISNFKKSDEFVGASISFTFFEGKLVEKPSSGPKHKLSIELDFQPNDKNDAEKVEQEIKLFIENNFKLNSNEFSISQAPSLTYRN
jgi:hypothetical protein